MDSARESLSNTAGGKIASAIREQGTSQNTSETPTDSGSGDAGADVTGSKQDEVNDPTKRKTIKNQSCKMITSLILEPTPLTIPL